MISSEPTIAVGVVDGAPGIGGTFNGSFTFDGGKSVEGPFRASIKGGTIVVADGGGRKIAEAAEVTFRPSGSSTFTLNDVTIGINFHWERKEDQTFPGALRLLPRGGKGLVVINDVPLEAYLTSVISSEMSAEAPVELLRAHAITSRSWLAAMLEREKTSEGSRRTVEAPGRIVRWYDREDHDLFDVCADDHCQRYQGITKIITAAARDAVEATRGVFLVYREKICDARFYKACGGFSESFENAWEDAHVPYLVPVCDSTVSHPPLRTEEDAVAWILSSPDAFCNTTDAGILKQILPSFDQETTDFFRWKVEYAREELEALLRKRSGIDFGTLKAITPVRRGPSGRIVELRIEGTKTSVVVGKELEIRKWLSPSHLYSSAFVVETARDAAGTPTRFILRGAGWGHGVGLCQIGASVMATRGYTASQIVQHYFTGAETRKLY